MEFQIFSFNLMHRHRHLFLHFTLLGRHLSALPKDTPTLMLIPLSHQAPIVSSDSIY